MMIFNSTSRLISQVKGSTGLVREPAQLPVDMRRGRERKRERKCVCAHLYACVEEEEEEEEKQRGEEEKTELEEGTRE